MNMKIYKKALKEEYKVIIDYLYNFGGKFGLISYSLLLSELVKFNNSKNITFYRKGIKELSEVDILKIHQRNNKKYITFSTSTYRELFNCSSNVDLKTLNSYHYEIADFKILSLNKMFSDYNSYFEKISYSCCFNKTDSTISKLREQIKYDIQKELYSLEVYNGYFLGYSDNYIHFNFYNIDKQNISSLKLLSKHINDILQKSKDIANYINQNQPIKLNFFVKKEDKLSFDRLVFTKLKYIEKNESTRMSNMKFKIYYI